MLIVYIALGYVALSYLYWLLEAEDKMSTWVTFLTVPGALILGLIVTFLGDWLGRLGWSRRPSVYPF